MKIDKVGNTSPQEHHGCKGQYPSWETSYDYSGKEVRRLAWCYGCSRTWFVDTGEEGPNYHA